MDRDALRAVLSATPSVRVTGRVRAVTGLSIRFTLPGVRVGDVISVRRAGDPLECQVVGFQDGEAVAMPLGNLAGVGLDDEVEATGGALTVAVGHALLGTVLDGLGRPLPGSPQPNPASLVRVPVDRAPPPALHRPLIDVPLATGVRVLDSLVTLGEGQRIGLFAGSGVGKSTLLGAIARGVAADVVVVGLVGERGREVVEFLEHALGPEGRKRSVVVVATSETPALERLRAAEVATSVAEYFRDEGAKVMLLVDSITRYARAQREIGLAAGEPPARRGYPPSVFAMLPRLLERSGKAARGSITAIFTVLVEGGDMDEPIADEVRGILDGHVVLDRALAGRGRYPAIDPIASLSRVMDAVVPPEQRDAARKLRKLIAAYEAKRDLVLLGAYAKGSDRVVDEALARLPEIEEFLTQDPKQLTPLSETVQGLLRLVR